MRPALIAFLTVLLLSFISHAQIVPLPNGGMVPVDLKAHVVSETPSTSFAEWNASLPVSNSLALEALIGVHQVQCGKGERAKHQLLLIQRMNVDYLNPAKTEVVVMAVDFLIPKHAYSFEGAVQKGSWTQIARFVQDLVAFGYGREAGGISILSQEMRSRIVRGTPAFHHYTEYLETSYNPYVNDSFHALIAGPFAPINGVTKHLLETIRISEVEFSFMGEYRMRANDQVWSLRTTTQGQPILQVNSDRGDQAICLSSSTHISGQLSLPSAMDGLSRYFGVNRRGQF